MDETVTQQLLREVLRELRKANGAKPALNDGRDDLDRAPEFTAALKQRLDRSLNPPTVDISKGIPNGAARVDPASLLEGAPRARLNTGLESPEEEAARKAKGAAFRKRFEERLP